MNIKLQPPRIIQMAFRPVVWRIPAAPKTVFLTFDDGPTPGITDKVLQILADFNARATFFCLGQKAENQPGLLNQIRAAGHAIGNHSYDHPDGWKSPVHYYLDNVFRAGKILQTPLFRPPYGHLRLRQYQLLKRYFRIVMWSGLTADFQKDITPEKCRKNADAAIKRGGLPVFHDMDKAGEVMLNVLPQLLADCTKKGYIFLPLHHVVQ